MNQVESQGLTGRVVDGCFAVRQGLLASARTPSVSALGERIRIAEVVLLVLCGSAAACAIGYIRLGLRIPGHAIVLAVIPMALGLALAPRRLAGSLMGAGAFGTAAFLSAFAGARYGGGSFVSLCLFGPVVDIALARTRSGWRLYLGLVVAGTVTNLFALISRTGGKVLGLDLPGTRPIDTWWMQALLTYTLSGAVAGLLGAIFWFNLTGRNGTADADRSAARTADPAAREVERRA